MFKIAPDGTESILYSFKAGLTDGSMPYGGVGLDHQGNLYGTTYWNGAVRATFWLGGLAVPAGTLNR
jgi:hypothetical protein